jgi:hypothetical protein
MKPERLKILSDWLLEQALSSSNYQGEGIVKTIQLSETNDRKDVIRAIQLTRLYTIREMIEKLSKLLDEDILENVSALGKLKAEL